jgi:hypothetical protein
MRRLISGDSHSTSLKLTLSVFLGTLLISSSAIAFGPTRYHFKSNALTQGKTIGIVIPLYVSPGAEWSSIIQAKQANSSVPFLVIINPNSGPGSAKDSSYATGIQQLQAAGIIVLGYVDTAYAADSISSVEANVNLYNTWYHVNGIMFDDMSNALADESYYATLNSYVKSLGMTFTMGNPGTAVPASEIGVFNLLDIYENSGLPALSSLPTGYPTTDFSLISIGVPNLNVSFLSSASNYASYIYITNVGLPNPYDALPTYFTSFVSGLASLDASSLLSTSGTASITVKSLALNGSSFNGMWTTVQTGGRIVSTGFTPFSFTGSIGSQYTVTVSNYQSYIFQNWQDGSTNPSRATTLSQNVQFLAYYSTPSTTTTTSSSSTASVTTKTASSYSQPPSTVTITTTVTAPQQVVTETSTVTMTTAYTEAPSTVTDTVTQTMMATTTSTITTSEAITKTTTATTPSVGDANSQAQSPGSITTTSISTQSQITPSSQRQQSQSINKSIGNLSISSNLSHLFSGAVPFPFSVAVLGALVPVSAAIYRQELVKYSRQLAVLLGRGSFYVKKRLLTILLKR